MNRWLTHRERKWAVVEYSFREVNMKVEYDKLALQFGQLLGLAQGTTLKLAHLTKQGMEFVFETETTRTQLRILPKVYTEGKVIIDAINDLTLVVEVSQFALHDGRVADDAKPVGGGVVELPYSTWFFEGDYL
jgi:L-arabinose isomerase